MLNVICLKSEACTSERWDTYVRKEFWPTSIVARSFTGLAYGFNALPTFGKVREESHAQFVEVNTDGQHFALRAAENCQNTFPFRSFTAMPVVSSRKFIGSVLGLRDFNYQAFFSMIVPRDPDERILADMKVFTKIMTTYVIDYHQEEAGSMLYRNLIKPGEKVAIFKTPIFKESDPLQQFESIKKISHIRYPLLFVGDLQ